MQPAEEGDDPKLDLLLVVGARRLADGEPVDPAPQVGAEGVLADLHRALMVDGGERFAERLFRLPARAEPTSGRLPPLHLAGVRVESRRPIEADPPPTTVLRLVAGDAALHHRTPGELTVQCSTDRVFGVDRSPQAGDATTQALGSQPSAST